MTTSDRGIRRKEVQRVAIVGGGLVCRFDCSFRFLWIDFCPPFQVGALNACFFAQRGWHVDLYEFREGTIAFVHLAYALLCRPSLSQSVEPKM